MRINTKIVLKNLKGEDLKAEDGVLTLGGAISNILSSDQAGGKMKLFILAQKFFTENELDLDSADLNLVKESIKGTKIYTALVAGQVEKIIEELKEEKKDK